MDKRQSTMEQEHQILLNERNNIQYNIMMAINDGDELMSSDLEIEYLIIDAKIEKLLKLKYLFQKVKHEIMCYQKNV
jgi:hypothetical protein